MDIKRTFQNELVVEMEKGKSWDLEGHKRGWSHRA